MKNRLARIGVFGGTFDPPHLGHLIIAEQARQQLQLDLVLFVPAFLPPHKRHGATATPAQRITMLKLATAGWPCFRVDTVEIRRKGTSYTVDTLKELKRKFSNARLFLLVGGDNFVQFRSWKSVDVIQELVTLVVYERLSDDRRKKRKGRNSVLLKGPLLDISSTLIRHKIRNGESIRFLTPRQVEQFIRRNKLYED